MCLRFLKPPKLHVAKEDIKVFKIVSIKHFKTCCSYFHCNYKYTENEIQTEPMDRLTISSTYTAMNKAFHSYSLDICLKVDNYYLHVNYSSGKNYLSYRWIDDDTIALALFIIPKGSKYYLEDDCYASDSIVYTGLYGWGSATESINRLIKSFKDYVYIPKQNREEYS